MDRLDILGVGFSDATGQCEQIRPLLSLYVDKMASTEEIRVIELHLAGCKDCESAYEWMLATHDVLASRPCAVPPADMSLRIRAAIAASREAETRQVVRFRTVYRPALAMAATAIVAAVTFGVFHRVSDRGVVTNPTVASRPDTEPALNSKPPIISPRPVPHVNLTQPKANMTASVPHIVTPKVKAPEIVHHAAPRTVVANRPADDTDTVESAPVVRPDRSATHPVVIHEIAPRPVSKSHASPIVAAVPKPATHKQPTIAPVRHPDTMASSHIPETHVPQEITPTPGVPQPEATHPTMVATVPEPPSPRSNGLLADVQGHVSSMSRQRAYNASFRVSSGANIRMTSYETPTDTGNHGESVSGTQDITH